MLLVDTSIWIEHFRHGVAALAARIADDAILIHPFVIGELACGPLVRRAQVLEWLQNQPAAPLADQHEVLALVERHQLVQSGVGWVDVHLLSSSLIAGAPLWTLDRRLAQVAQRLGCSPGAAARQFSLDQ
jgi:hypothetical protein